MSVTDIFLLVTAIIGFLTALTSILSSLTCVRKALARNYGYLKNVEVKFELLRKKKEEFLELIIKVDRERRGSQVRQVDVDTWMRDAEKIVEEINGFRFQERLDLESGYVPKCHSRFKVGKSIAQKINLIDDYRLEGEYLITVIQESSLRGVKKFPRNLVGNNANDAAEEIWTCLVNDEVVRIIAVNGMGGIGKTAVVKMVNDRILNEKTPFDCIVWVDVPDEHDLVNLQKKLANAIGLDISSDGHNAQTIAANLLNALLKKRRFLIIFDDMWTAFSLEEIGIPEPTKENGCKLIIVSRSSSACSKMKTDRDVNLGLLSDDEAWKLFIEELGRRPGSGTPRFSETQSYMKNVSKECAGLPLAIITVARSLRKLSDSDVKAWHDAWSALKRSAINSLTWEEEMVARLRFSFERLQDDLFHNIKLCFLYCALYPRHHLIETKELMQYWIWEGLLGNVGWIADKMQQAEEILQEIKSARLLESVQEEGGVELVKMHALVRDMAIHITTKADRTGTLMFTERRPVFFINAGHGLRKSPHKDEWPIFADRASLMRNDVKELQYSPYCPSLSSLMLQYNSFEGMICDEFFDGMPNLKVLDMSFTGIRVLPNSLSSLKKLRALFLRSCWDLRSIPSLSDLSELMVLDLTDTRIGQLPEGMLNLTNLRRLNLTRTRDLIFPPGLIQAFRGLEEFLVDGCGFLWELRSTMLGNLASVEELIDLRSLLVLEANFSSAEAYRCYFRSGHFLRLRCFKFSVGGWYDGNLGNNSVAVMGRFFVNRDPILLPDETSELRIMHCPDLSDFSGPKHLKILDVSECENLKYLFKNSMLQHLENLEEIIVKRCRNMEGLMIVEDENDLVRIEKLRKLTLVDLPKLRFPDGIPLLCFSLETITVWNCPHMKIFPVLTSGMSGQIITPENLKEIRAQRTWFEALKENSFHKDYLRPYLIEEPILDEMPYRLADQVRSRSTGAIKEFTGSSSEVEIVVETEPSNRGKAIMIGSSSKGTGD